MFDLDNWQEIWTTITRNKLRSLLTGFGIFWGIFMLVLLLGIGNGFRDGIQRILNGVAANTCVFLTDRTSEPYRGYRKGRAWEMNARDVELIRGKARWVEQVAPVLYGAYSDKNVVRGMKSGTYNIMGVLPAQFVVYPQVVMQGRLINEMDVEQRRKVCVISPGVYETLFSPGENPLGKYIRVKGIYFQVVGVSRMVASNTGQKDESFYIPFTTMRYTFSRGDRIHQLFCIGQEGVDASLVEQEVKMILREAHDIAPNDEKAILSYNTQEMFQIFNNLILGVDLLIWIVGLGALMSGMVGISNIMLVTVRERTREIGVRRALGAKPVTILKQLMSESVLLTFVSGIFGFLLGVFILEMMARAMTDSTGLLAPPSISFNMSLLALFILVLAGVAAGILPTIRALKIKAIDAIRDE